jgi:hypothetical protein
MARGRAAAVAVDRGGIGQLSDVDGGIADDDGGTVHRKRLSGESWKVLSTYERMGIINLYERMELLCSWLTPAS